MFILHDKLGNSTLQIPPQQLLYRGLV